MATLLNHPRTVEFLDLAKTAGWKAADVARQLGKTPGYISYIYSGKRKPSASLLELLRLKVAAQREEREGIERGRDAVVATRADELNDQISYLRQHDPAGYRSLRTTTRILFERAVEEDKGELILHDKRKRQSVSSGLTPEEVKLLAEPIEPGADGVRGGAGSESERRPGVDGQTSRKDEQSGASSHPTKSGRRPGPAKESQK